MGLLVLGVVAEEVVGDVVDGGVGLGLLLGEGGEGLEDEGDDGGVEVGADGEGLEVVLGGLRGEGVTWLMECNLYYRDG